jgi:hypothetical protein
MDSLRLENSGRKFAKHMGAELSFREKYGACRKSHSYRRTSVVKGECIA